jgi:hypothetical protein
MRLLFKLSAAVFLAVVAQFAIKADAEWLDEAQFSVRVSVAAVFGEPVSSPDLLDAADQLLERRFARNGFTLPTENLRNAMARRENLAWQDATPAAPDDSTTCPLPRCLGASRDWADSPRIELESVPAPLPPAQS